MIGYQWSSHTNGYQDNISYCIFFSIVLLPFASDNTTLLMTFWNYGQNRIVKVAL